MKYNAATGAMCFASALVSMKKGGKVRRIGWRNDCYLQLVDGLTTMKGMSGPIPALDIDFSALIAEDWEEAVVPL